MLGNGRLGAPEHGLTEKSRILCAAPLSHLYGLYSLHCAWAVGACTFLLPAFKPDDLGVLVQIQKPTALWTAPAHVAACRAAGVFDRYDWSSLELAIVSGSIAAARPGSEFRRKAAALRGHAALGNDRAAGRALHAAGDPFEMSATTAGRPSPGTEVRLSKEGELQVRGPSVFSGYSTTKQRPEQHSRRTAGSAQATSERRAPLLNRGLLRDHRPQQGPH